MPPTIGPVKLRNPPSSAMNTISPENVQYKTSGVVKPFERHPQDAGKPGEDPRHEKRDQAEPADRRPKKARAHLVVANACSALPNGEWTITHMSATRR